MTDQAKIALRKLVITHAMAPALNASAGSGNPSGAIRLSATARTVAWSPSSVGTQTDLAGNTKGPKETI